MPKMDIAMLIWASGMLLPAFFISALIASCLIPLCRTKTSATPGAFAFAIAAGLGLIAHKAIGLIHGDVATESVLGQSFRTAFVLMPGDSSWNRLSYAALAALLIGRLARREEFQPAGGWMLRGAASFVIAWSLVPSMVRVEHEWLTPAFGLLILLNWTILERLSADLPGGGVPACAAVLFGGAAVVLIHASIGSLMEVALPLAAACAGLAVAGWWFRADMGGAMPGIAVLLPGLLLIGNRETAVEQIPWYVFALPALGPVFLAEAWLMTNWQEPRWRVFRVILMLMLVALPLAFAIYVAHNVAPLDLESQG